MKLSVKYSPPVHSSSPSARCSSIAAAAARLSRSSPSCGPSSPRWKRASCSSCSSSFHQDPTTVVRRAIDRSFLSQILDVPTVGEPPCITRSTGGGLEHPEALAALGLELDVLLGKD